MPRHTATRASSDVPARRRRRAVAAAVGLGVAVAAACSSAGDREVADVTLPRLATTTTTTIAGGPSPAVPDEQDPPAPVWSVQFGGPGDDVVQAVTSRDDEIVAVGGSPGGLAGRTEPPTTTAPAAAPTGGSQVLMATVGTDGELRSTAVTGSDGDDVANGVTVSGGELLACGATSGQLGTFVGGSTDLWCALLGDGARELSGTTQFGGADREELTGVAGSGDGDGPDRAYASGSATGLLPGAQDPTGRGLGSGDAVALQLGSAATPVWIRQFGTPHEDAALGVATTPDGDGILVGYTDGDLGRSSAGGRDAWITRFDPQGRQRWVTQFGSSGTDVASAVTVSGLASRGTEQFVVAGTTDGRLGEEGDAPLAGPGEVPTSDAFVAAFGPDGALQWTTTVASSSADRAAAIVADGSMLYVAGTTSGDLGDLVAEAGPGGGEDGFVTAIDATTGSIVWTARFGSEGDEQITGATTTEDGLLVLSGTTSGQMADTEPAGGTDGFLVAFPLSSAGGGAASSV